MDTGGLQINLADPADIRAKRAEIKRLYAEKRRELKAATEALQLLHEQVELLGRLAGNTGTTKPSGVQRVGPRAGQNAPSQDRAVAALEKLGQPVGPTSLHRYMVDNNMDAPKDANTLGSNLWSAWKARRIMKAPNGVYTPLDGSGITEWDQPLTDYYDAARKGMPVPAWPIELPTPPDPANSDPASESRSPVEQLPE
jgi:hypothetical protein